MITIRWLNANPIYDLKKANLVTQRKKPKDSNMTVAYFGKLLEAEHSTLRFLSLEVFDDDTPYTVATQLVRHTKEHTQPEMSSGRPDWTGKERDYSATRWLIMKFTPIGLIRMMEQRTCSNAEDKTREWANSLRSVMLSHDNPYIRELSGFCVPRCTKLKYCPEVRSCGWYPSLRG